MPGAPASTTPARTGRSLVLPPFPFAKEAHPVRARNNVFPFRRRRNGAAPPCRHPWGYLCHWRGGNRGPTARPYTDQSSKAGAILRFESGTFRDRFGACKRDRTLAFSKTSSRIESRAAPGYRGPLCLPPEPDRDRQARAKGSRPEQAGGYSPRQVRSDPAALWAFVRSRDS